MTDISESGIEAALAPCPFCGGPVRLTQSKTLGDRLFVIECERNSPCFGSGLGNYVVASQKAEAIEAWNRRHPPASREDGLRVKALEWGKEYSERTDGSGYFSVEAQTIVGRYSAYRMDATKQWILEFEREVLGTFDEVAAYRAAAQEHYTNAVLSAIETALIPTKPEAGESAEPYRPCLIRNEEAGFTEFVTEDVPAITGHMFAANVEPIVRMSGPRGEIIGYRIYDAALQSKKPE